MKTVSTPLFNADEIRKVLHLRDNDSLRFFCQKCKVGTAGIYVNIKAIERKCPSCKSTLMHCPVCRECTSGTEKYKVITCDKCSTDFITDSTIEVLEVQNRESKDIVLSGIRATGELHLGNYFGAIRQFVEYEKENNLCMYFIADWHTLTTCQDPKQIMLNSIAIATDYLAAGINPERSIIYTQSSVPEIAELALYLSMVQNKNRLEDLPTVKDLVRSGESMKMGHLFYPILMAADILGPRATVVPVGSDQIPNVELARELAEKFNRQFGTTFVIPRIGKQHLKVPSLTGGKMGKSDEDSSVSLRDSLEIISDKYLRLGITDKGRKIRTDSGIPDNCVSVYPVYKILYENDQGLLNKVNTECRSGVRGCRECKLELAKSIHELIQPFQERRLDLLKKQKYVKEVLHFGAMKAREIIQPTLMEVREKLGIMHV